MYGIPARCKPLSAAEEQVLLAVWETPAPVTRRAVARQLAGRGWASGTVLTFLTRLEAKGWLTAAKEANHNVYTPTVTRRAYGVAVMRHRLDTLFGGDLAAAVRALVSECGATPASWRRRRPSSRPSGPRRRSTTATTCFSKRKGARPFAGRTPWRNCQLVGDTGVSVFT